ncbi:MAG: DUF6259 domain-containing protein [Eubacteriales bacterium]|jgi:hypothetical protein
MTYLIENAEIAYALDDCGRNCSFYNKKTGHEYVLEPAHTWKLIWKEGQRTERPVFAEEQDGRVEVRGNSLVLSYEKLFSGGRELDIGLALTFTLDGEVLYVTSRIENRSDITVTELNITAASGIRSINGSPETDRIMWPASYGKIIEAPAISDLSVHMGFRKYERLDHKHTDLDLLYPGGSGSMPWFDLYSSAEGLYVGSHDLSHQTICLHAERNVKTNLLSLGVIRYPFTGPGEVWEGAPIVYQPHKGDWRSGARIYRRWAEESGYFVAPKLPDWARHFEGWLRVILKPHHCEINWNYKQIPELFDEAQAVGIDTIFLLGWERGGFARMWPDFVVDNDPVDGLGTEQDLRDAIEYVHSKGGRVIMFVSYFLIDRKSDFYLKEGGEECLIKSIWDEDVPFAETYCGEATYRKLPNPPMPMYGACPGSDRWHEKMKALAEYCLDLGCDGVLYDLGGLKPYLCFSDRHDHKKPNMACASKARRFADLRKTIKARGEDKIILMEHLVDCFNQHMDISQSSGMNPRHKINRPDMYRYTFPELVFTNRGLGMDEVNYRDNVNITFVYGLAFDMTIFRCCGRMSDIPNYAEYLKKIIALRKKYAKFLHEGRFIGDDGFTADPRVCAKAYRAADGSIGVAVWNLSHEPVVAKITNEAGRDFYVDLEADGVGFVQIQ